MALSWTLANFRCSETAALQVFLMPAGIFARSRARPGPTKNSVYPYILGHFAHPPLRKLAKVQLSLDQGPSGERRSGQMAPCERPLLRRLSAMSLASVSRWSRSEAMNFLTGVVSKFWRRCRG